MRFPRIPSVEQTEQKFRRFESVLQKENETGTSKVGAISKAQEAQRFLNMLRTYS